LVRSISIETLYSHNAEVLTVAVSPDNHVVASGSTNGKVNLWNLATKTITYTINAHSSAVTDIAWSPDGTRVPSRYCL
jgi:WD40 repeat protein